MPTFTNPRTWATDELVTAALMNTHVRDQFNAVPHLLAYKTADEAVVSSTTLQDDNDLLVAMAANDLWYLSLVLVMTGTAPTPSTKIAFTIPAGATMSLAVPSFNPAGSIFSYHYWSTSGTSSDLLTHDPEPSVFNIQGIVETSSTAGNFQLQFAQNSSSGTPVTMKKGSAIYGLQLA